MTSLEPQKVMPVASPHTKLTESVSYVILIRFRIRGSSPITIVKFVVLDIIRLYGE